MELSVTLSSITQEFSRSHQINSRYQKCLVEINFERDQKFNQRLEFSNLLHIEGISIYTMHGCLQGKDPI